MRRAPPLSTPAKALANVVILLFVGGLVGLGVRTLVMQDARYGWGMFIHQVDYRIRYAWVIDDGRTVPMWADNLRGEARSVNDDRRRRTRYGIGAVRSWVSAYLRYRMTEPDVLDRPRRAVAAEATLVYQINRTDPIHRETLRYPHPRPRK